MNGSIGSTRSIRCTRSMGSTVCMILSVLCDLVLQGLLILQYMHGFTGSAGSILPIRSMDSTGCMVLSVSFYTIYTFY